MGATQHRDPLAEHLLGQKPARGLGGFFEGVRVPWEGYCYMRRHRRLWRYGLLPLLLSGVFTSAVFAGLIFGGWHLYSWAGAHISQAWWGSVLRFVLGVGVGTLVIGAGVATALALNVIFCSYFYLSLARAVERQLGVRDGELFDTSVLTDLGDGLASLFELVFGNLLLFAVNLVPVVGPVAAGVGSWYFNAFVLGAEFLAYPWTIRGRGRRERRAFARAHRTHVLGLGTMVVVFNLVPFLGGAVLTTAVTGSVFLRRRLLAT